MHRQCAHHVVGFISGHLDEGDAIGFDNALNLRHRPTDVFGGGFALRLVGRKHFVPESRSGGVEAHGYQVGLKGAQQVFKGVDKTEHCRCVLPLGIDARGANQTVVSPKNEGVSVKEY